MPVSPMRKTGLGRMPEIISGGVAVHYDDSLSGGTGNDQVGSSWIEI